jgi:phosphatidylglycerophosphatase C
MNAAGTARSAPSDRPGLALFDFDGTLTRRDTVLPFLLGVCGNHALPRFGAVAATALLREPAARRDAAKAAIIKAALRGRVARDVDAAGAAYARTIVQQSLRAEGRARLEWHRAHGHRLVIVSASLEPYLGAVAELLDVDTCLCTQLEVDDDGVLTGAMAGANCRGDEKARRVRAAIEPGEYEVWAYGDTHGDRALLALADHPVWVGNGLRRRVRGARNAD